MLNPMITMPGGAEWFIILAIVILVFGAAKLPELARGTGQALRIFKAETKGLTDSDDDPTTKDPDKKSALPTAQTDETPIVEPVDQPATVEKSDKTL